MKLLRIALLVLLALVAPAAADDISNWSPVDSSNTRAPPLGWPVGMLPSQVRPTMQAIMGAIRRFYDNTHSPGAGGRTVLSSPANLYVATSGADTGNCTDVGSPCASIQYACTQAISNYDQRGNVVNINIADGTYSGGCTMSGPQVGGTTSGTTTASIWFIGDLATPDNVVVNGPSFPATFLFDGAISAVLEGMKIIGTGALVFPDHGAVAAVLSDDLGCATGAAQLHSEWFSQVKIAGNLTVSCGGIGFVDAIIAGSVQFPEAPTIISFPNPISYSGASFNVNENATIYVNSNYNYFVGPQTAQVTASQTGFVLTVTAVNFGTIGVGNLLTGTGTIPEQSIASFGTGSGGVGTYNVGRPATYGSTTITLYSPPSVTGSAYLARNNGVIDTIGGDQAYLPGTITGETVQGGMYSIGYVPPDVVATGLGTAGTITLDAGSDNFRGTMILTTDPSAALQMGTIGMTFGGGAIGPHGAFCQTALVGGSAQWVLTAAVRETTNFNTGPGFNWTTGNGSNLAANSTFKISYNCQGY